MFVEGIPGWKLRYRHQGIAPHITNQVLYRPLLVSLGGPAKVAVEEIMGSQAGEDDVFLPFYPSQNTYDSGFWVVVEAFPGYPAQPLVRGLNALLKPSVNFR